MLSPRRLIGRVDFQNHFVRGLTVLISVGLLGLLLWHAGILQRDPNEQIEITDASGNPGLITVRRADVSIETPNGSGGDVEVREGKLAPNFEVSTLKGGADPARRLSRQSRLPQLLGNVVRTLPGRDAGHRSDAARA